MHGVPREGRDEEEPPFSTGVDRMVGEVEIA
jgi:hypothetical protein